MTRPSRGDLRNLVGEIAHHMQLIILAVVLLVVAQFAEGAGSSSFTQAEPSNAAFERPLHAEASSAAQPETGIVDMQSYRWYTVGAVSVATLQTLLMGWLLVEHRQRRRAEAEVRERLRETQTQLVTITHLDRRAAMVK